MNIEHLINIFSQTYPPAENITDCGYLISTDKIIDNLSDSLGFVCTKAEVTTAMVKAGFKMHMSKPFYFEWMIADVKSAEVPLLH